MNHARKGAPQKRKPPLKRKKRQQLSLEKIKRSTRIFFREYRRELPNNSLLFAPFLITGILLLLFICNLFFRFFSPSDVHLYVAVAAIYLIALYLPTMLYLAARPHLKSGMGFTLPRAEHISLIVLSALTLFFGAAAITSLTAYFGITEVHYSLYTFFGIPASTPMAGLFFSLLTFAVIPAILEEILFRGVIFAEFKAYGPLTALVVSSVLSALLPMQPASLLSALFCGFLLGLVRLLTDSLLASVTVHLVYRALCLFYEHFFGIMGDRLGEFLILFFLCAVFALLFAFFLLGELERYFRRMALERRSSVQTAADSERDGNTLKTRDALRIFAISPTTIGTVILYFVCSFIL